MRTQTFYIITFDEQPYQPDLTAYTTSPVLAKLYIDQYKTLDPKLYEYTADNIVELEPIVYKDLTIVVDRTYCIESRSCVTGIGTHVSYLTTAIQEMNVYENNWGLSDELSRTLIATVHNMINLCPLLVDGDKLRQLIQYLYRKYVYRIVLSGMCDLNDLSKSQLKQLGLPEKLYDGDNYYIEMEDIYSPDLLLWQVIRSYAGGGETY